MSHKILVVEDDHLVVRSLVLALESEGFQVTTAYDGPSALALAQTAPPDLVILDVMLPGLSGLEVCRRLREHSHVPVIMLTARIEEVDVILGLEVGADDYVTKPCTPRELLARVRAQLRRAFVYNPETARTPRLQVGVLGIDADRYEVELAGRPIRLTPKEFDLLYTLALAAGRVLPREELLEQVWGESVYIDSRTLDVHIRRLRLKLEADPAQPRYIETVPGVGYRLNRQHLLDDGEAPR